MKVHLCPRSHVQDIPAPVGFVLCIPCMRQIRRDLRALPALHQESLHHVSTTSARMNPTKVSGTRNRDHLNISVLDTRRDLLATLESWSQAVVEELGGTPPQHTAAGLAQFLIENLKSLCCRPEAADFADEIANTATELRRIIDPGTGTRALDALTRNCVVDDCTGTITVPPRRPDDTGSSTISCSSGHSWEIHEWLALRQLMEHGKKDTRA